jgi:hypothetical protein
VPGGKLLESRTCCGRSRLYPGGLVDVDPRPVHPPILIGIICQVQEPVKQFKACSLGQPEPGCMSREAVREGTRIVISQTDRVSDKLSYSLAILVVSQQV